MLVFLKDNDCYGIDDGVGMKIVDALKTYLTDWKNLLTHGIVGVILLYCLLFAPVAWYWRVILLILVIAFNILRMRYSKNKKEEES